MLRIITLKLHYITPTSSDMSYSWLAVSNKASEVRLNPKFHSKLHRRTAITVVAKVICAGLHIVYLFQKALLCNKAVINIISLVL